jgi:hypothetical protein
MGGWRLFSTRRKACAVVVVVSARAVGGEGCTVGRSVYTFVEDLVSVSYA